MNYRVSAASLARVRLEAIVAEAIIIVLALAWLLVIQGPAPVGR